MLASRTPTAGARAGTTDSCAAAAAAGAPVPSARTSPIRPRFSYAFKCLFWGLGGLGWKRGGRRVNLMAVGGSRRQRRDGRGQSRAAPARPGAFPPWTPATLTSMRRAAGRHPAPPMSGRGRRSAR